MKKYRLLVIRQPSFKKFEIFRLNQSEITELDLLVNIELELEKKSSKLASL